MIIPEIGFSQKKGEKRYVHYIEIIDTEDRIFRLTINPAQSRFYNQVKVISERLGVLVAPIHHRINGERFMRENIEDIIDDELKFAQGDIIFLLYFGHGYQSKDGIGRPDPILWIEDERHSMIYQCLVGGILQHKPSVLVTVINTCNAIPETSNNKIQVPEYITDHIPNITPQNYDQTDNQIMWHNLFPPHKIGKKYPKNTLVVEFMSSHYNTYANIDQYGGPFFRAVTTTLDNYLFEISGEYNWGNMQKQVEELTMKYLKVDKKKHPDKIKEQIPVCRVEYKSHGIDYCSVVVPTTLQPINPMQEKKTCKAIKNEQIRQIKDQYKDMFSDLREKKKSEINNLYDPKSIKSVKAKYKKTFKDKRKLFQSELARLREQRKYCRN